jgi:hypothetical protein
MVKPYQKYHKLPILVMLFLAFIRYDTTTDYNIYVEMFYGFQRNIKGTWHSIIEPGYIILNKMFSFSEYGFFFVIGICAIISYLSIYYLFKSYKIVFWGTIVFLLLGFINIFDNIVRQSVAMGFFACSYKYVAKKRPMHYFFLNLLGVCFHYSAIATFVYYPIFLFAGKIKISPLMSFVVVLLFYILFRLDFFLNIIMFFVYHSPIQKYRDYFPLLMDRFLGNTNLGLGVLVNSLIPC